MTTYVFVLGCKDQKTSEKRVARACEFYREKSSTSDSGPEYGEFSNIVKLIFSGMNEAEQMKSHATEFYGIPERDCMTENDSVNTIQNITNCKNLIGEAVLGYAPSSHEEGFTDRKKICICTSTYHISRAVIIAKSILKDFNCIIEVIHTNEKISQQEFDRESKFLFEYVYNGIVPTILSL